ncbi:MAG TPA: hypothetical protein VF334_06465 [Polyangia bacterium]
MLPAFGFASLALVALCAAGGCGAGHDLCRTVAYPPGCADGGAP